VYWAVAFQSNGSGDLAADHVCWGTDQLADVQAMVFDFFDDASLGIVSAFPLIEDCDVGDCAPKPKCPAPADLDCNGTVSVSDLLQLLSAWGECDQSEPCPEDLNDDGVVGVSDLLQLLGAWGDTA